MVTRETPRYIDTVATLLRSNGLESVPSAALDDALKGRVLPASIKRWKHLRPRQLDALIDRLGLAEPLAAFDHHARMVRICFAMAVKPESELPFGTFPGAKFENGFLAVMQIRYEEVGRRLHPRLVADGPPADEPPCGYMRASSTCAFTWHSTVCNEDLVVSLPLALQASGEWRLVAPSNWAQATHVWSGDLEICWPLKVRVLLCFKLIAVARSSY
jgi:hypothetical protein